MQFSLATLAVLFPILASTLAARLLPKCVEYNEIHPPPKTWWAMPPKKLVARYGEANAEGILDGFKNAFDYPNREVVIFTELMGTGASTSLFIEGASNQLSKRQFKMNFVDVNDRILQSFTFYPNTGRCKTNFTFKKADLHTVSVQGRI